MKTKLIGISIVIVLLLMALLLPPALLNSKPQTKTNSAVADISTISSTFSDNPNVKVKFDKSKLKEIWVAGGCFWGIEAYMQKINGVYDVTSGYANGNIDNPTYEQVCSGTTHFAETVHVLYDPERVSLNALLTYFFKVVDPTSKNRQGNDSGVQYRSGIYYKDAADKTIIDKVIKVHQEKYKFKIYTEVLPLKNYFLAEEYHQNYLEKDPAGYCHIDFSKLNEPVAK